MKLQTELTVNEQVLDADLGVFHDVSDDSYRRGYSDGTRDSLWQRVTALIYTFSLMEFPEDTQLVVDVPNISRSIEYMIYGATGIKKLKLKGNVANNTLNCTYPFMSSVLEELDLTEFGAGGIKFGLCKGIAYNCTKLVNIYGELDFSEVQGNIDIPFSSASSLERVRFKAGTLAKTMSFPHSQLLSADSIQSVLDGLADLTGQTAQTLTFHAVVGAKLTDAQKATVTARNWTLVY